MSVRHHSMFGNRKSSYLAFIIVSLSILPWAQRLLPQSREEYFSSSNAVP